MIMFGELHLLAKGFLAFSGTTDRIGDPISEERYVLVLFLFPACQLLCTCRALGPMGQHAANVLSPELAAGLHRDCMGDPNC